MGTQICFQFDKESICTYLKKKTSLNLIYLQLLNMFFLFLEKFQFILHHNKFMNHL